MTIRVGLCKQGIALNVTGDTKQSEIGKKIRSRVPRDHIISSHGEFVLPACSAYLVAEELAGLGVDWTDEAWRLVEEQRQILARITSARCEVAEALSDPEHTLADYSLLPKLDRHQVEAVSAMAVPSLVGMALFDEQGLGKTIMALCAFDRLREKSIIRNLIVLAPKSVLASWSTDLKKLFPNKYVVKTVGGTQLTRRRRIRSGFDILLSNYESAVSELDLLKRTIQAKDGKVMLVVDESYFVKNPGAKRSKAVAEIRQVCDRAIILCGTPAPNSAKDLINQIRLTDSGYSLANRIIPKDKDDASQFVASALDNIIYLRRLKNQVFPTIPTKEIQKIIVNLCPRQQDLYDQAKTELVLSVRSIDDREFRRHLGSYLARRAALTQICSHPGAIDPLYSEVPAKLLALDKMIEALIASKRKVIVWSFYRYSLDVIATRYKKSGLVRIDGSVPNLNDRKEAIRRFQEDDQVKIFLGNAAAAGAGITLTAAHHAIYESFSNQAAHYMQSVDRIHRRGQEHDVTYHVLLAKDTIENREYERLLEKERAGRDLLGDHYQEPITRERFLSDLGEAL